MIALTAAGAANKRIALVSSCKWMRSFAEVLGKEFHPKGYSFATRELPKSLVYAGSFLNPEFKLVLKLWDYNYSFDTSVSKEVLGVKYRDLN